MLWQVPQILTITNMILAPRRLRGFDDGTEDAGSLRLSGMVGAVHRRARPLVVPVLAGVLLVELVAPLAVGLVVGLKLPRGGHDVIGRPYAIDLGERQQESCSIARLPTYGPPSYVWATFLPGGFLP